MGPTKQQSTGVTDAPLDERRLGLRRRCLRGAVVSFNKGYSVFECVAKNISNQGARLSFGETFSLPTEFDVLIAPEPQRRKAQVVWRTMSSVGVKFVQ